VTDDPEQVHSTALLDVHRALGGRLIEFGGWLMPVQYSGILEEHRAVRERAGLFDLSHMGELFVEGPDAGDALAASLVSDPRSLAVGRAQYSMIVAADGGVIDDLIVYRLGPARFLVVANAGNAATVSDVLAARLGGWKAVLDDRSLATSLVAIQGPLAASILERLVKWADVLIVNTPNPARKRLKLAYGEAAAFTIGPNFPNGVAASILVPTHA